MRVDGRRGQWGMIVDRPHQPVGFRLRSDDPRAAATERPGHADGDVGAGRDAVSSHVDLRPRATAPLGADDRRSLERHREHPVRATRHGHALVVAELDGGDRHGPRPRARVRVDVARRAIAIAVAAGDDAQCPPDLAGNRGRDIRARRARYGGGSTAQCERHEQHDGEVLDGSLATGAAHGGTLGAPTSRHNRAIAPSLRRISDDGTSVRPQARGRRRGRVRRS